MPELIPTEQVRADRIKEGDVVWYQDCWRAVEQGEPQGYSIAQRVWTASFRLRRLDTGEKCRIAFSRSTPVLRQAAPASPLGLREKLDEMRLYENTGDPGDEGYMNAIRELDDWLASQENTGGDAPCPCREPAPDGYPPCTPDRPCPYAQGMDAGRWGDGVVVENTGGEG